MRRIIGNVLVYFLLKNPKFIELWKKILFDSLSDEGTPTAKSFAEKLRYVLSSPTMKQFLDLQLIVKELKDKLTPKKAEEVQSGLIFSDSRKIWVRQINTGYKDEKKYAYSSPLYTEGAVWYRLQYPDVDFRDNTGSGIISTRPFPTILNEMRDFLYAQKLYTSIEIGVMDIKITKSPAIVWDEEKEKTFLTFLFKCIEKANPDLEPVPVKEEQG